MALWHNDLDPYVTVLDPSSSRILALVLDKPGYQVSVHITIYLATAGKDPEFIGDLAELEDTIDIISEKYPNSIVYVRGDANSSPSIRPSNKRDELLVFFINNNNFKHLQIGHKTYHHFMNNGQSDSAIDVLLSAEISSAGFFNQQFECLLDVFCSKTCPWIDSSHDLIMSSLTMDPIVSPHSSAGNITAPRVATDKHKIVWSTEGISNYQELLNNSLQDLQSEYSGQLLSGSASVLLQATNHILTAAAKYTNKAVFLSAAKKARKPFTPPAIKAANKDKLIAHKNLLSVSRNPASSDSQKETAEAAFKHAKSHVQSVVRAHQVQQECQRDLEFQDIISKEPNKIFKDIKSRKLKQGTTIKSLAVGNKVYTEDSVADGFFESISKLKTRSSMTSPSFESFSEDHKHILEICKQAKKIPRITPEKASNLLKKIRPTVADFYSVTAAHYINGGDVALTHFCFLFNTILDNIELAGIPEMNTAHAIILHKGHGKDKSLDSSYRTISSCPFLAKCIDVYLGELSKDDWSSCQAPTQFQGEGSSHELAALLLTITIHWSSLKNHPLFVLLLDAKSAFDRVL